MVINYRDFGREYCGLGFGRFECSVGLVGGEFDLLGNSDNVFCFIGIRWR